MAQRHDSMVNPPIEELIRPRTMGEHNIPEEIWLIKINPTERATVPVKPGEIIDRRNQLEGNISLFQQLGHLEMINDMILDDAFRPEYLARFDIKAPIRIPKSFAGDPDRPYDYGPPHVLEGVISFVTGAITIGQNADGKVLLHCHSGFIDGDGTLHGGHLLSWSGPPCELFDLTEGLGQQHQLHGAGRGDLGLLHRLDLQARDGAAVGHPAVFALPERAEDGGVHGDHQSAPEIEPERIALDHVRAASTAFDDAVLAALPRGRGKGEEIIEGSLEQRPVERLAEQRDVTMPCRYSRCVAAGQEHAEHAEPRREEREHDPGLSEGEGQ